MKKLFFFGILGLIIFEFARVYFIMPIPGSQEIESINLAYFLHSNQWIFRFAFGLMILLGIKSTWKRFWWLVLLSFALLAVVIYMTNFKMVADHMFYQPKHLVLLPESENEVDIEKLIIGVAHNGVAKAYPIQFLGFHHQVRDSIGGKPIMVTYCTVCRTGRVFEPVVNGKTESFRLVGMDHYNAMFEDETTGSWWRQETGEAVAGNLAGQSLKEVPSTQASLENWLSLYPHSLIMQPDTNFQEEYDSLANYEGGRRTGRLTRRDTVAWEDKSWIAGIVIGNVSKAYDWDSLLNERIIYDVLDHQSFVIFVAGDNKSLFAYKIPSPENGYSIRNDTLTIGPNQYNLLGYSFGDAATKLEPVQIYQEYWHSWKTFHPNTLR